MAYNPYGAPSVNPQVQHMFMAVDKDRSGQITAKELQVALINSNWSPFNEETCRLMISMFDRDGTGTINLHEFQQLYDYIEQWKRCFQGFDQDKSGNISSDELHQALTTFGYRLSPHFSELLVRKFDRFGRRSMEFDSFIQACVMLKCLTDAFRMKDTAQNGTITVQYQDFLEMVFNNAIY
ncbi:programmed cell death protein 6-like isoform X2 [Varroa jacobsoni]|uniref:EF-hand domain-containing protein n=1 Tax=Varroa destructor TaxID=109461 RepID=A0A7M7M895_VARDE|nr:programmed cell death protein 6-like isoform X2 [Varroa destructor]XP_022692357.1 programmed cell death protein 6-like isoform X2 [Varroa jacobsoni]